MYEYRWNGQKIVEFLFDEKIINNIVDIFKMTYEDLSGKEGWQDKKINNLLNAINATINIPLWRFVNALGIEHIGETASKKIAKQFGYRIFDITYDEIIHLDGIGEEMAKSLVTFMQTNKDNIRELLKIINPIEDIEKKGVLEGEIIVLTGSMSDTRDNIASMLENMGAKIATNINKKVTIVVYGDNPGSKLDIAKKNGIRLLDETALMNMIKK